MLEGRAQVSKPATISIATEVVPTAVRPALDAQPRSQEKRPGIPHLPVLDGMRGIAILMVMVLHFVYGAESEHALGRLVLNIALAGTLGVDLFFVLSGFLITRILLETRDGPRYFRNFYWRRALRIFPLYYGFLILYFGLGPFLPLDRERVAEAASYQGWIWLYGTNILICLRGGFIVASVNHCWTLAIEEHFYLLWPALVWLAGRRVGVLCVATILLAITCRMLFIVTHAWPMAPHVFTFCRVDSLVLGGLLAVVERSGSGLPGIATFAKWAAGLGAAYVLAVDVVGLRLPDVASGTLGATVVALGFAGILTLAVLARPASVAARLLSGSPLGRLGIYAYGLYVFITLSTSCSLGPYRSNAWALGFTRTGWI